MKFRVTETNEAIIDTYMVPVGMWARARWHGPKPATWPHDPDAVIELVQDHEGLLELAEALVDSEGALAFTGETLDVIDARLPLERDTYVDAGVELARAILGIRDTMRIPEEIVDERDRAHYAVEIAKALDAYLKTTGMTASDLEEVEVDEAPEPDRLTPNEQATMARSLDHVRAIYTPAPPMAVTHHLEAAADDLVPPPGVIAAMARDLAAEKAADAEYDEAVASGEIPGPTYDIEIVDQGYEPGTYGGWTVQFRVKDLPRLSYQKVDPVLEAFIRLEMAAPDAPKLGPGSDRLGDGGYRRDGRLGGTALARTEDDSQDDSPLLNAMVGGGQEGQVLRGFTGAAVVEVAPVAIGNAPVRPSDERVAAACRKSIDAHLAAVAEERKRLDITENTESIVGKKMRV